jgi:hypothetical protein
MLSACQLGCEQRTASVHKTLYRLTSCLLHGAQVFVTNDRRLECLKNKIDILILDDFIAKD